MWRPQDRLKASTYLDDEIRLALGFKVIVIQISQMMEMFLE
jgi:hypothetical protein